MDIDEDVIFLVGNALRASDTTSSGLAIGIHGHRISWREIWKSGNLEIWEGRKIWKRLTGHSSRFFAKSQKVGLEKSGVAKSLKKVKKARKSNYDSHPVQLND